MIIEKAHHPLRGTGCVSSSTATASRAGGAACYFFFPFSCLALKSLSVVQTS